MQNLPTVAICTPTFNQAQYLEKSVRSSCNQTYPNVEVWVSDNASTDETAAVMAKLCQEFPQLHYHRQDENIGMAANGAWVMSQPKTDFIVLLDSDDIIAPTYVETLVALMQKYPEAGYAHAAMQEIDEYSNLQGVKVLWRQEEYQNPEKALQIAVTGHQVASPIILYRTKVLQELNFYDRRLGYGDDYDLDVRIADAGYGNAYTNKILSYYRVWSDVGNTRARRKGAHLQALIFIYQERLMPAFQRRGWNTKIIDRYRQQLALRHSTACFSPIFNDVERAELVSLLKELGDSPALRLRLLLLNLGFAPFLEMLYSINLILRSTIKKRLSRPNKPELQDQSTTTQEA